MIVSPPLSWGSVPVGAVALIDGVPRTVLAVRPVVTGEHLPRQLTADLLTVLIEGIPPRTVKDTDLVQLAWLDDTDAIAALAAAGLNPEVIDT